jgi:hypothetical protein
MTTTIDYRNNCWFLKISERGDELGFWTLPAALSFATNNLKLNVKLTNQAILAKVKMAA